MIGTKKGLISAILAVWITSIVLIGIFINSKYESNQDVLKHIEQIYIKNLKEKIKDRIENLATLLTTTYSNKYEAIDFMDKLKFDDGGYIFVLDKNKTMLVHKNKMLVNVPFDTMTDKRYKENVNHIVSSGIEKGNLYINYKQSKTVFSRDQELNKISYIKYVPTYNFILGTGLYDNDIQRDLKVIKKDLDAQLKEDILHILLYSIIAILGINIALILFSSVNKEK